MNEKYYCKCCDYNAKVKSSYLKHLKTNKHLSKMEKFQNVSEMYPKCIQMYPNVSKMSNLMKKLLKEKDLYASTVTNLLNILKV